MLKILHLNSEYASNGMYNNLVRSLSEGGVKQVVYASIKNSDQYGNNEISDDKVTIKYSRELKPYHRWFYFRKINYLFRDIESKIDVKEIHAIHAHKLFSDGGVALKFYKKYRIPYIVAIRSTDIFVFYRYMKHLKFYARDILLHSNRIVLLNSRYKEYLKSFHPNSYYQFKDKIEIIPNGIDEYWFKNSQDVSKEISNNSPFNLVYTGTFIRRKKVFDLLRAVVQLNEGGFNVTLTLVGKGGYYQNSVERYANNYSFIHYVGKLDFSHLISLYGNMHAFVMPSVRETFGLVYIEALSQGLPIIYSKGEAIDSYFEEGQVGYSIVPGNINSIIIATNALWDNYSNIQQNCYEQSSPFNWKDIANKYVQLYQNTIE